MTTLVKFVIELWEKATKVFIDKNMILFQYWLQEGCEKKKKKI